MQTSILSKPLATAMKGVAILLVMLSHVGNDGFRLKFLIPLGAIAVAVFLVLSGYGLMESYAKNGLSGFWRKRFLRVLLPYFLWMVAYAAFLSLNGWDLPLEEFRYWFVEYILLWYAIFYFVLRFVFKYRWLMFIGIAILLFLFLPNLHAQQSLSFIVGMAISEKKDFIRRIPANKLLMVGCISLLFGLTTFGIKHLIIFWSVGISTEGVNLLELHHVASTDYWMKFLQLLPKVPFAVFIIIMLKHLNIDRVCCLFVIGLASYETYLVFFKFLCIINGSVLNVFVFIVLTGVVTFMLYQLNIKIVRVLHL